MNDDLSFSLESVKKIVISAYETGYCDGIEDKNPEWKDYEDAEDYWKKNKAQYIDKFAQTAH